MPVLAIAGAVGALTIGGGAAAIGAVVAGTATLATTLTAVAAVGATLGAVGAVTGDKTLSTVGLVLGGVGGVGALAANAGVFGASATTESLFGASSSAATSGLDPALNSAGESALQSAGASANADIVNSVGNLDMSSITPSADLSQDLGAAAGDAGDMTAATPGLLNSGIAGQQAAGLTPDPSAQFTGGQNALNEFQSGANTSIANNVASQPVNATPPSSVQLAGGGAVPTAPGTAPPAAPGATPGLPPGSYVGQTSTTPDGTSVSWNGTSWAKQPSFFSGLMNNQYAQFGMIQAGGSLISGLFNPVTPAQVDQLESQAAENKAAAAITQTQATNMAQPLPVATRVATPAVTGQPAGLINTSPNANTVTGMTAT